MPAAANHGALPRDEPRRISRGHARPSASRMPISRVRWATRCGHDPVYAYRAKREREDREQRDDEHRESPLGGPAPQAHHSWSALRRAGTLGSIKAEGRAERIGEQRGIAGGADGEIEAALGGAGPARPLRLRHVHLGPGGSIEPPVPDVSDDARPPCARPNRGLRRRAAPAVRSRRRPATPARECLIDDDRARRTGNVPRPRRPDPGAPESASSGSSSASPPANRRACALPA